MSLLNHANLDLNVPQRFSFFSSASAESKENERKTEASKNSEASEDAEAGKATGEPKEAVTDSRVLCLIPVQRSLTGH